MPIMRQSHAAITGFRGALDGTLDDGEQIVGALRHVDMRIFL